MTREESQENQPQKSIFNKTLSFSEFAGSSKCTTCHKNLYEQHIKTAHFLSTKPGLKKFIHGSFESGKNAYAYSPFLKVVMEKRDSGLYQVIYYQGVEKKAIRFDLVIGSGTKGQSFAYWDKNRLFQMPITYFTNADQWSNSPGFPDKVMFDRPITSRCLECHASFVETISAPEMEKEEFDHDQILYGIDCEKCHGPAEKHVAFQTENPQEKNGRFIINPASLTRQQNLDLCALCHGGRMQKLKPSFSFRAGDTLSEYFDIDTLTAGAVNTGNFDVHGNQYGLLRASQCFKMSVTMTCTTCHSPHEKERNSPALFSARCMSCHRPENGHFCKINPDLVPGGIKDNCVDCHMPVKRSQAIVVVLQGHEVPIASLIRSHFISINQEETKKVIEKRSKNAGKKGS